MPHRKLTNVAAVLGIAASTGTLVGLFMQFEFVRPLQKEKVGLLAVKESMQDDVKELRSSLADQIATNESLHQSIEEFRADNVGLGRELERLRKLSNELKDQIGDRNGRIEDLRRQLGTADKSAADLHLRLAERESTITRLEHDLKQQRQSVNHLNDKIAEVKQEQVDLRGRLELEAEVKRDLEIKIQTLTDALVDQRAKELGYSDLIDTAKIAADSRFRELYAPFTNHGYFNLVNSGPNTTPRPMSFRNLKRIRALDDYDQFVKIACGKGSWANNDRGAWPMPFKGDTDGHEMLRRRFDDFRRLAPLWAQDGTLSP